jgi:transposase-like protein
VAFRQRAAMDNIDKRRRLPISITQHAVWIYYYSERSILDAENLIAERNISVSYEVVRRWLNKLASEIGSLCALVV